MSIAFPDISRYQGAINWSLFKPPALIIKAGGADQGFYKDPKFDDNAANATANKIPWMAYFFTDPTGDPVAQANFFLSLAGTKARVPDIESGTGDQKPFATAFCKPLNSPIIYSGLNHLQADDLQGIAPVWVAAYGQDEPPVPHIFWQHSDNASYPGLSGPVDESLFNGTLDQLVAIFNGPLAIQPTIYDEEENVRIPALGEASFPGGVNDDHHQTILYVTADSSDGHTAPPTISCFFNSEGGPGPEDKFDVPLNVCKVIDTTQVANAPVGNFSTRIKNPSHDIWVTQRVVVK